MIKHSIGYLQSNPDKVLASVLCQSEDFIRTRTLSGLASLRPCMCEIGLYNADPKHKVQHLTWISEYWYNKAVSLPFFRQVSATTLYYQKKENLNAEMHPNLCAVYAAYRLYSAFFSIQLQYCDLPVMISFSRLIML